MPKKKPQYLLLMPFISNAFTKGWRRSTTHYKFLSSKKELLFSLKLLFLTAWKRTSFENDTLVSNHNPMTQKGGEEWLQRWLWATLVVEINLHYDWSEQNCPNNYPILEPLLPKDEPTFQQSWLIAIMLITLCIPIKKQLYFFFWGGGSTLTSFSFLSGTGVCFLMLFPV